jgi:hypothetical protein
LEQLQQYLQKKHDNLHKQVSNSEKKTPLFYISQPTYLYQTKTARCKSPHHHTPPDRHRQLLQYLVDERGVGDEDMPDEYPLAENNDAANILLELREVYNNNYKEEEEVEQAQQPQPYQLTPPYQE